MTYHGTMIKRFITAGAFAALSTTALTGMAQAQDLRMTVWTGSEAHLDMLNGIAAAFAEDHPGVTVSFETVPFADYVQKITLQLAGGNAPDMGWLLETSAPTFVQAGVLAEIGETLRGTEGYDFDDLSQPAMGLWQEGDDVYGVPFSTSPFIIYYNASMYDAAGLEHPDVLAANGEWTWEVLAEQAATLTDPANGVYGFQSVDGEGYGSRAMHTLIPIIRAYGGDAWSEDGTCGFASPEAVEAATLYHDMIYGTEAAVPPGEQGDFFTGNAALTMTQISRVSKLDGVDFDWGIAPLPSGPAGDVGVVGQAAVVAFANAPHPELAAEFIAFMTNAENTATMSAFFPPARASVLSSDDYLSSNPAVTPEQMQIVAGGIETGKVLPDHPAYPQIEAAMRPAFDALWQPDADPQAAMDGLCAAIEPLL
ncbi:sugar ABC transporter substrate-binding protein [Pseudoroseicyclus sp. CXY001]|uniref:ABC transporter substrate-binding protein n=1 Tax=Pseudoroseicyclus sp. CXY001 TaxID=3242492 RepID=UPI00358DCA9C